MAANGKRARMDRRPSLIFFECANALSEIHIKRGASQAQQKRWRRREQQAETFPSPSHARQRQAHPAQGRKDHHARQSAVAIGLAQPADGEPAPTSSGIARLARGASPAARVALSSVWQRPPLWAWTAPISKPS